MSRVINVKNPTTVRNQHRRTIAEILRLLGQKPRVDTEAKDMAAMIVLLLREIKDGVDSNGCSLGKARLLDEGGAFFP